MAEALKDIYSKMDDITKSLDAMKENLKQFFSSIGQKNMIVVENLKRLQGVVSDFKTADELKQTIQVINSSIMDIRDGIWYLEFQKALERFQDNLDEY